MSKQIAVSFNPPTPIDLACDKDVASRYALGAVCVSPIDDKSVWLTATDGRIMAAVQADGSASEPVLCPMAAVKAKPAARDHRAKVYRDNGHWVDRKKTMHEPMEGRFPRMADVCPRTDNALVLAIDAALLHRLAQAICIGDRPVVTLLIQPAGENGYVENAIGVSASGGGIGVIMPCTPGQENGPLEIETYQAHWAAYGKQFKAPTVD